MTTDHDQPTSAAGDDAADGSTQVEHRRSEHRFVLSRHGADLAHVEYVVRDGVWFITHTFTEPTARGQGLAAQVVQATLDGARTEGVRVRPICPYVVGYVELHPEYAELLAVPGAS